MEMVLHLRNPLEEGVLVKASVAIVFGLIVGAFVWLGFFPNSTVHAIFGFKTEPDRPKVIRQSTRVETPRVSKPPICFAAYEEIPKPWRKKCSKLPTCKKQRACLSYEQTRGPWGPRILPEE